MKKLLVLPFYNLADRIADILPRAFAAIDDGDTVLVVDDGSSDDTDELIQSAYDGDERLFYFRHEAGLGFGGVMISALDFARKGNYDCIIAADARGSNFTIVTELCSRAFGEGYEIVNVSRNMSRAESDKDYAVFSTGTLLSGRVNSHTGLTLADMFSPYKAFLVSAVEEMTLEEFDESWILQLWIQSVYFGRRSIEVFCSELSGEYVEEIKILEKDPDYYNSFLDGEFLLYPADNSAD